MNENKIRERAYYIWLANPDKTDVWCWLTAEAKVKIEADLQEILWGSQDL